MKNKRWLKLSAAVLAMSLIAAACGDSGDSTTEVTTADTTADTTAGTTADTTADTTAPPETTEAMAGPDGHFGEGVDVDLEQCVDWSDTTGVEGDEIRIGTSQPQSGPLAVFGGLGRGMEVYFNYINETDPIDGKQLVLVQRDDVYDAATTKTNVEEMIETGDIFAIAYIVGSPNNLAARSVTNENCVPQLFNATGLPHWGDPVNFPWTVGGLINYATEANLWCEHIASELGEGATVAGLFMGNEFGKSYQDAIHACADAGTIDLVKDLTHEATAPDILAEIADLASSGADAFVLGSTGAFCPQSM